jgi:hypothetical protein
MSTNRILHHVTSSRFMLRTMEDDDVPRVMPTRGVRVKRVVICVGQRNVCALYSSQGDGFHKRNGSSDAEPCREQASATRFGRRTEFKRSTFHFKAVSR